MTGPDAVLDFWFVEHGEDDWFGGKAEFDAKLAERFTETHARVASGEAWTWRGSAEGRLAEVIVLDQFSRQLHRGSPRAFAQDPMALALAQEAVARGLDEKLEKRRRTFLYMPYMHSESLVVHEEAVRLFTALGDEGTLKYEIGHRDCIARFGRYPFRNKPLGRQSSAEELAYMQEAGTRGF
jgi:uncharacterized protein (DUF924 family)